jgi:hypothetical protein
MRLLPFVLVAVTLGGLMRPALAEDGICARVEAATRISNAAEARLERLNAAQRRANEDCAIEQTMFEANEEIIALVEQSPTHCGHTEAGLELMRASLRAMKRIGC